MIHNLPGLTPMNFGRSASCSGNVTLIEGELRHCWQPLTGSHVVILSDNENFQLNWSNSFEDILMI